LLLNKIDTPLEFEEKDEKKQSNPQNDILGEKRHLLNKFDLIFFFFLIVC
jgi:hypothetical protein